jgi:hypothetical protein
MQVQSIYKSEAERLRCKPKRKRIANPHLDVEMARYKEKIENKFRASKITDFTFPRVKSYSITQESRSTEFRDRSVDGQKMACGYKVSPSGSVVGGKSLT